MWVKKVKCQEICLQAVKSMNQEIKVIKPINKSHKARFSSGASVRSLLANSPESYAIARLPEEVARRYMALPINLLREGNELLLSLVMADLPTAQIKADLKFAAGCDVRVSQADRKEIEEGLFYCYLGEISRVRKVLNSLEMELDKRAGNLSEQDSSIKEAVYAILDYAIANRASDIHFEPYSEGYKLRIRVDGALLEVTDKPVDLITAQRLIRCIKVLCALDITKIRSVQDGAFSHKSEVGAYRLRSAFVPCLFGQKLTLRFLDEDLSAAAGSEVSLENLGLTNPQAALLRAVYSEDSGAIIFSGPTGSGKTTLLHTIAANFNSCRQNIISLEEPVERIINGVNQIQVEQSTGMNYPTLLKAVLRQDPDVLIVGEIRDYETGHLALSASLTGHLLFSTIHASNALEVLIRLIYMGVARELITASIKLVSAQRLIAKNCPNCTVDTEIDIRLAQMLSLPALPTGAHGKGCEACNYSGIYGRVGVFEFLPISERIRTLVEESQFDRDYSFRSELYKEARRTGYEPLAFRLRELLVKGIISPSEAIKALGLSGSL